MSDRRFDGIELIEWADKYGHPEEWAKKAQDLHAKNERLAGELAQVKAERDDWKIRAEERRIETDEAVEKGLDLAGSLYKEREDARAERDTAISHLEAVLDWSNTERFAGRTRHENDAPSLARAFLLSMREKADL